MFFPVSQSDVHFSIENKFFLRARLGAQEKLRAGKIWRLERNLSTPEAFV